MLKTILIAVLPLLLFFGESTVNLFPEIKTTGRQKDSGTLEKMVAASGKVVMSLDMGGLTGSAQSAPVELRFEAVSDSFFTVKVYNGELRGPIPSSLGIAPQASAYLPTKLSASYNRLIIESLPWGGQYDLVVRDADTGFVFFNIEGYEYDYDATQKVLNIKGGRMLISNDFAAEMGRPSDVGKIVGELSISTPLRVIEVTRLVDGDVESAVLPAGAGMRPDAGMVPGPDVIVGDVNGLGQFGTASGGFVGLALGTDSCNAGTVDLNWFALPSNDHPVIPQNLYRMSGGANNSDRFEQIGQSSVKHGFTALTEDICELGCNGIGNTKLGSGCSDPYSASLNAGPSLGSRAWVNPFTGAYPRGDSATPPNTHGTSHTHTGPSHRILTQITDLNTSLNTGATYYAEGQYVTPHEYTWCQANPTECNMNNNVSYRRYNVLGTASPFSFVPVGATVRTKPAIHAWTGATISEFLPDPANDGVAMVGYKVTNPSPGVWRYEYAIYNQNLDRAIRLFTVPLGSGATVSNASSHAPPQHPGWTGDGTVGNTGFSSAAWTQAASSNSYTWSTETFAANPNANAIRWGTLYNFRFDSNTPPQTTTATVGFFKTGEPILVRVQAPSSMAASVSGRVLTPAGIAIRNVIVSLIDGQGAKRTATTNSFGIYTFENVPTGTTFTLAATSKRYRFAPQTLNVNASVTDLNLAGLE